VLRERSVAVRMYTYIYIYSFAGQRYMSDYTQCFQLKNMKRYFKVSAVIIYVLRIIDCPLSFRIHLMQLVCFPYS
jgi:hypothetical protein